MSTLDDTGMSVWVSDIDGYIDIDAISHANQREEEYARLEHELDSIGEIPLLAGKAISAHTLNNRGISPPEWRWAMHQAERSLYDNFQWTNLELPFVKGLLSLGRTYAISRYSKWERLAYSSALIATLPHGLKALLNQFLVAEGIAPPSPSGDCVRTVLKSAEQASDVTAYRRTGMLQSAIYQLADCALGYGGRQTLSREGMRVILSLTRLHFSASELKIGSLRELRSLIDVYETERTAVKDNADDRTGINGPPIRAWRLRHVRPLIDLYPYSVRHGIARTLQHHSSAAEDPDRSIVVNELALAHCGIILMRRAGRDRTRSK